jgi:hypothetical protein
MNSFNIKTLVIAVSLAFSAGAMAENMSKVDYQASKDKIAAEYKSAKSTCSSLSGNAKDICVLEAKGKDNVALAELEAGYKPTSKNNYKVSVAKAEAAYSVAKEKCDDVSGNAKDVCVKEAKAAQTDAKADAKAKMKTSDANATANVKTSDARIKAKDKSAEARKDAKVDKMDADYSVAKEKCDTYAGGAKDKCLDQAKLNFGKP